MSSIIPAAPSRSAHLTVTSPGSGTPGTSDLLIALGSALMLLAWDFSGLDLWLMRHIGSAHGFAWRNSWLLSEVMHDRIRLLAWTLVAALTINIWKPLPFAAALSRPERLRWLAATLACAAAVAIVKHASTTSCPWSLAEFGGAASYVPHWAWGLYDGGPGGCFPSGHAATAFSFLTGWFALRHKAPRSARIWLAATLIAGSALGAVQVLRGAHYPSHPLWTAWICWTLGACAMRATTYLTRSAPSPMPVPIRPSP
jgi:membrane-associated PAP2 superfamily phosphatase